MIDEEERHADSRKVYRLAPTSLKQRAKLTGIRRGSSNISNSLLASYSSCPAVLCCAYLDSAISPRFTSFSVLMESIVLAANPLASIFSE